MFYQDNAILDLYFGKKQLARVTTSDYPSYDNIIIYNHLYSTMKHIPNGSTESSFNLFCRTAKVLACNSHNKFMGREMEKLGLVHSRVSSDKGT